MEYDSYSWLCQWDRNGLEHQTYPEESKEVSVSFLGEGRGTHFSVDIKSLFQQFPVCFMICSVREAPGHTDDSDLGMSHVTTYSLGDPILGEPRNAIF